MSVSIDNIHRVIVTAHNLHAMKAGFDNQPLPPELLETVIRVHGAASLGRPLNLADYRQFWESFQGRNPFYCFQLIEHGIRDIRAKPLTVEDRGFCDHMILCCRYLHEQGFQGLDDDRDHWEQTVTSNWTSS